MDRERQGGFWDASIYADEQMEVDSHWHESAEGKFLLRLIQQESQRLQAIIDSRRKHGA